MSDSIGVEHAKAASAEAAEEHRRAMGAGLKFWQRRHEVVDAPPVEFPAGERARLAAAERERLAKQRQAAAAERRRVANEAGQRRIEELTAWRGSVVDQIRGTDAELRAALADCDTDRAVAALRTKRELPGLLTHIDERIAQCRGNTGGAGLFYDNYGRLVPAERI